MSTRLQGPRGERTLLLALLCFGSAGLLVVAGIGREQGASASRAPAVDARAMEPISSPAPTVREALPGAPAPSPEDTAAAPQERRAPRTEREHFAAFLALSEEQPGALEACAAKVLDGTRPEAESVAYLRALLAISSPRATGWLEHAVIALPDDSGPHGSSVPSFALDALAARAKDGGEPAEALHRLAFARELPDGNLRRRAALACARTCAEAGFDALDAVLVRETDELLVSGVLAALAERGESPGAQRVLARHSRAPRVAGPSE